MGIYIYIYIYIYTYIGNYIVVSHIKGLITLLITTHEPPSRVAFVLEGLGFIV